MDHPNVASLSIDLHRRPKENDYVVSYVIRPLRGGTHTAVTHVLEPKLHALIHLLGLHIPKPPDKPIVIEST